MTGNLTGDPRGDLRSESSRDRSLGEPPEGGFLFSPSSSYPTPVACLVDGNGALLHAWSNDTDQPDPSTVPASYLRGWNHVEVDADGNLYATVPLQSLLKLDPDSRLLWRAPVAAHHDLDVAPDGTVYVLTERVRTVSSISAGSTSSCDSLSSSRGRAPLLDAVITVLSPAGQTVTEHSIYDSLRSDPDLARLIDNHIRRRSHVDRAGRRITTKPVARVGTGARRDLLSRSRDEPGSPADVLHANSLALLTRHPSGLWGEGCVIVSLRNLDLIAVLDLDRQRVVWWWGPRELSGQHEPSVTDSGTVMVFDNGVSAGRSRVVEVDPISEDIVWQYAADPPHALFTQVAGGCQPLPHGRVLITDAAAGRALIVDRRGRMRWCLVVSTTPHADIASKANTVSRPDTISLGLAPSSSVEVTHSGGRSRAAIYRMTHVPPSTVAALRSVPGNPGALRAAQGYRVAGSRP